MNNIAILYYKVWHDTKYGSWVYLTFLDGGLDRPAHKYKDT